MPTRQERRDSERVPCKLVVPFEMTKPVDPSTVKFSDGHGHAINRSVGGMLLLLPEKVNKRQVVEIQVPSKAKKKQSVKLVEVRWTRSIPVSARVKMYLAGTRFLFELPAPRQLPQTR
jgi:creatinine amidohydrolase/Fe(II)-dependent formamide hydrolase-like protein